VKFDSLDALKAADPASVKGKIVYIGFRMTRAEGRPRLRHGFGDPHRRPGHRRQQGRSRLSSCARPAPMRIAARRIPASPCSKIPPRRFPPPRCRIPMPTSSSACSAYGKPVSVKLDLDCGIVGTVTGANVIGEITGRKHPEQIVAIGGHLDSWDLGTGAIDDGAGVAIAMAAGKLIHDMPQRPDRTIRVIAFANEEMGLWGGIAYADKHASEVAKHQLGTESDFGSGPVWRMSASVKPEARAAIAQIAGVLAPIGVAYDENRPGGGGSDLSQMHGKGMAALTLTQDGTMYFDWHHNANDTLDKIDPKELAQNVAVYASFCVHGSQGQWRFWFGA
jgi:hypothetical protein